MRNWRVPVTFTLTVDGQITSWSENVRTVLGYGPNEFLGRDFTLLFTPDDVAEGVPARLLAQARQDGSATLAGWRRDKAGERLFVRGEMAALQGLDGGMFGFSVVLLPSSAGPSYEARGTQRMPVKALEQLDPEKLAEMLSGIDERFFILDQDFNFVYANQVAQRTWGKSREELVGFNLLTVFPQIQDTEFLGELLKAANEGVTARFETLSGLTGLKVEVSAYPNVTGGVSVLLRDPFERAEHFSSMIGDERLAEAYAALEIAVLEWEPETGVLQESLTTPEIFGLPPGEHLGGRQSFLDLVLPADVERYQRVVNRALDQGESWRTEYRICRPVDGEIAWIEEHGSLIRSSRRTRRYAVLAWDVTASKLAEERLRSSQRRLQQELASNRRLQEIMSRTSNADDPRVALGEVLAGAIELFAVHQGTLRVYAREEGALRIVAQRWFDGDYLEQHAEIAVAPEAMDRRFDRGSSARAQGGTGGAAGIFLDQLEEGGYRERWVPLVGLNGHVVGVLVLHWRRAWSFSERDEHDLVVLARQAAGLVEAFLHDQRSQDLMEHMRARVAAHGSELMESEIRFRRAFEVGPVAACITTMDEDRFLEVNSGYMKLTGYTAEEVVGRTSRELGMWSSAEDRAKLLGAFEAGGEFRELELRLRTKEGQVRDILLSGQQISYDGQTAWLKMFNDVTEQHRSQEELMTAIREVMSDTAWFGRSVVQKLAEIRTGPVDGDTEFDLTSRERQVIELVAAGLDDTQISDQLGISQKTVRNHLANAYAKAGVHSRAEAVIWARDRGLVARL